jgi:hypothetical protein
MGKVWVYLLIICFFPGIGLLLSGCISDPDPLYPEVDRRSKIPADIVKQGPDTDLFPPILHSGEFEEPIPVPGDLNTSGAEDSPFVLPCGNQMYFFFTPDVRVPVEEQLLDSVSGVWHSLRIQGVWTEAKRIWLNDPDQLSLDGAVCIQGSEMWFASAREGYVGVNNFIAENIDGKWTNWEYAGDRIMKDLRVGETHLHGDDLYYHSDLEGGKGDFDIWKTSRSSGNWSDPVNISEVNSAGMDGWPCISYDGTELWLTRTYQGSPSVYRSKKESDHWTEPELIISQFAGEPTLDKEGNLYFTHHFFDNGEMIEADIYVAMRKQ